MGRRVFAEWFETFDRHREVVKKNSIFTVSLGDPPLTFSLTVKRPFFWRLPLSNKSYLYFLGPLGTPLLQILLSVRPQQKIRSPMNPYESFNDHVRPIISYVRKGTISSAKKKTITIYPPTPAGLYIFSSPPASGDSRISNKTLSLGFLAACYRAALYL